MTNMRKIYILFAVAAVLAVAGCQKPVAGNEDNQEIPGYDEKNDPNRPSGNDDVTVSPEEYIKETAKALMDELNYNKWSAEAEFIHKVIVALQNKHIDDSKLESWVEALEDSWSLEPRKEGNNTIYDNYIRLSDAKGHFEEQPDGTFTQTEANDFQIIFLIDGEKVSATFACTDSKVPVRISSGMYNNYDYETQQEYYEYRNTYIYVPESASAKILRGTSEFATLDLHMSADVKAPQQVNPYTDSASLEATFKIGVYTLSLQKVEYSPTGASAKIKLLSGSSSLITVDAKAGYELDPASTSNYPIPIKGGNINASVDVMGRIQLKADIPDVKKFLDAGLASNDKQQDANAFKALVAQLDESFTAAMYFNGSSNPRATLGVEPAIAEGSQHWYINPVIKFSDGTSYGIEEYFSEERFGDLISYANSWLEGIKNYVSTLFRDVQ